MMIILLVLIVFGCVGLGVLRFVRGPSDADRIVALDILFSSAVALCTFAALSTQRVLFLDIALGLVLISFVATLGWSRLLEMRNSHKEGIKP